MSVNVKRLREYLQTLPDDLDITCLDYLGMDVSVKHVNRIISPNGYDRIIFVPMGTHLQKGEHDNEISGCI